MKELNLEATVGNLSRVLEFITAELEAADCPMKTQMQIELAAEEIFVNIAKYAYKDGVGTAEVQVDITDDPRGVEITFADRGVPYDPLAKEDPDVTLSAEERGIGGLGIFMTKKIMDRETYRYEDGQNVLTLLKLF